MGVGYSSAGVFHTHLEFGTGAVNRCTRDSDGSGFDAEQCFGQARTFFNMIFFFYQKTCFASILNPTQVCCKYISVKTAEGDREKCFPCPYPPLLGKRENHFSVEYWASSYASEEYTALAVTVYAYISGHSSWTSLLSCTLGADSSITHGAQCNYICNTSPQIRTQYAK